MNRWIDSQYAGLHTAIIILGHSYNGVNLQVCEYGLGVCAGVPVADRGGLLEVWVQCKQLLQQPIPGKTFGVEEKVGVYCTKPSASLTP